MTRVCGPFPAVACSIVLLCCASFEAVAQAECTFRKLPPVSLKNMGPCAFDPVSQSFAGDSVQQASCLLTSVSVGGKLGEPAELPAELATRIGRKTVPQRESVLAELAELGLHASLGASLHRPVSQSRDGTEPGRTATYLVIHDTSGPNFRSRQFPATINDEGGFNKLANIVCANNIERAHTFISRTGAILLAHDYSVPWRATKFEMAQEFGADLKGLFLHVELIQPRRSEPRMGRNNDYRAPSPAFTAAQYDALALIYVVASVRAGFWMVPAYHAVIDEGIYNKHDDPQGFSLEAFAQSLKRVMARIDSIRPDQTLVLADEHTSQSRPGAVTVLRPTDD